VVRMDHATADTSSAVVLWRDPRFNITGVGTPERAVATYNGTCVNLHNTNQYMIAMHPRVLVLCIKFSTDIILLFDIKKRILKVFWHNR